MVQSKTRSLGRAKRLLALITVAAVLVTSIFVSAPKLVAQADTSAQALPEGTRTEKSTSTDYVVAKFPGIAEGQNVIEPITYERLRKGVLDQEGKSIVLLGSPKNETSQATFQYINEVAIANGIQKVYFFDPNLGGERGSDIVPSDTNPSSRAAIVAGNGNIYGLWAQLTTNLHSSHKGSWLSNLDLTDYTSDDTYLFVYDKDAADTNNPTSIDNKLLIEDADLAAINADNAAALKTAIADVFSGAGISEGTPETRFNDYDFISKFFTNLNPTLAAAGFTSAEGFNIQTVTQPELVNILNTPGTHNVFMSGSWCGDSRGVIGWIAQSAKQYNETVYLYDFRVDASSSGLGNQAHSLRSETPTTVDDLYENGEVFGKGYGDTGIAYLGNELVELFAPFNAGTANVVQYYHPNGDLSAPLAQASHRNFRSPFLVKYEKGDNNEKGKVVKDWTHTYQDYEKPWKSAKADWILTGDYEVSTGNINTKQSALGREKLSEFFGASDPISHTPTKVTISEGDSEYDSGCGNDLDKIDNLGDTNLIPNNGTTDYDVQDYDIKIQYNPDKVAALDSITGTTTVTAIAKKDLKTISLDFRRQAILGTPAVRNITAAANVAVDSVDPIDEATHNDALDLQKLNINLGTAIPKGKTFSVTVTYTTGTIDAFAAAGESPQGFSKSANSSGITAIGEPFGSTYWFPNNNTPNDGAKYKVTLIGPSAYTAISSGVRTSTTNNLPDTGLRTTVWQVSQDTAPYQVFASLDDHLKQLGGATYANHWSNDSTNTAAYKIELSSGKEIEVYAYVDTTINALNGTAGVGARNRDKVDLYTNKLALYLQTLEGIAGDYPGESAGFTFANLTDGEGGTAEWGAVETKDRPFYTNNQGLTSEATFVHEQAHQWFGDSVRPANWKSLWLNEGFATYVTDLYYEKAYGISAQAKYEKLYNDTKATSKLWGIAPADIKKESDLFGGQKSAYNRGALALSVLRKTVGDDTFDAILKTWTSEKAGKAVTTADFIKVAQDVSGTDLSAFSKVWLYGTVKPAVFNAAGSYDITKATISKIAAQTYNTKALKPTVTVKDGSKTLASGTDYTVAYKNNTNAGTATVTITGKGSYVGTKTATFTINKAKASALTVGTIKDQVNNAKAKKPALTVKLGSVKLTEKTHYTVAHSTKTTVGKATIKITGKNYSGTKSVTFKIIPKATTVSKATVGKKQVTATWGKVSGTTKYQVQYKEKGTSKWSKAVAVAGSKNSLAIKNLKKGKKYDIQVRSYKTVKESGKNVNYYSAWSKTKTSAAVK
jgi:hypothetical protein